MNILILGIRCPSSLGKISGKAIHTFSLTLVRKKFKEQTLTGTATLRHTVKMDHGVSLYPFLSICLSH